MGGILRETKRGGTRGRRDKGRAEWLEGRGTSAKTGGGACLGLSPQHAPCGRRGGGATAAALYCTAHPGGPPEAPRRPPGGPPEARELRGPPKHDDNAVGGDKLHSDERHECQQKPDKTLARNVSQILRGCKERLKRKDKHASPDTREKPLAQNQHEEPETQRTHDFDASAPAAGDRASAEPSADALPRHTHTNPAISTLQSSSARNLYSPGIRQVSNLSRRNPRVTDTDSSAIQIRSKTRPAPLQLGFAAVVVGQMRASRLSRGDDKGLASVTVAGRLLAPEELMAGKDT